MSQGGLRRDALPFFASSRDGVRHALRLLTGVDPAGP